MKVSNDAVTVGPLTMQERQSVAGGGGPRGYLQGTVTVDDAKLREALKQAGFDGDKFDGMERIVLSAPSFGSWSSAPIEHTGTVNGVDQYTFSRALNQGFWDTMDQGAAFQVETNVGSIPLQDWGQNFQVSSREITDPDGVARPTREGAFDKETVGQWRWFEQMRSWFIA